jgi:predicted TIM-barrel fold metal-dependent hydrolase
LLAGLELLSSRYGDYSAIRKAYLPYDYFRDTVGHQIIKTVHVEAK